MPLRIHQTPPIVGREQELRLFATLLKRAASAHGSLVLFSGEAGIGKTALLNSVGHYARDRGVLVLHGHCYDLSMTPPYAPWAEVLAEYDTAQRRMPELPVTPDSMTRGGLAEIGSQEALFAAAMQHFRAIATQIPLLIILEDMHWSDVASFTFTRHFARQVSDCRILLAFSYRNDEVSRGDLLFKYLPPLIRESETTRVTLRPLKPDAIRSLIDQRYDLNTRDRERLIAYVLQYAEGNPLFSIELLHALENKRILERDAKGWQLGPLDGVVVPTLARQVIEQRLMTLDARARELLEVAAIIGNNVPLDLWTTVSGASENDMVHVVTNGIAAHILEDQDSGNLRFVHALFRETLYESVVLVRRRRLHADVANNLMQLPGPDPDQVAHHLDRAGDPRAADWWFLAGERADEAYAWIMAADRFERAASYLEGVQDRDLERAWLLFRIAEMLRYSDFSTAIACLTEAATVATAHGDSVLKGAAIGSLGQIRSWNGDIKEGIAALEKGVQLLERLTPAEIERARAIPTADLRMFENIIPGACILRGTLLIAMAFQGRISDALAGSCDFVATVERSLPQPRADVFARDGLMAPCLCYAHFGEPEKARLQFQRAREACVAAGNYSGAGTMASYELWLVTLPYYTDQPELRQPLADKAAELWKHAEGAHGWESLEIQDRLHEWIYLEGDWNRALRASVDKVQTSEFHWVREEAAVTLGLIARNRSEPEEAWRQVAMVVPEGVHTQPGAGNFINTTNAMRLAVDLAIDACELEKACSWLEALDRWMDWSGAVLWQAERHLLRARYHLAANDPGRARQYAESALKLVSNPRQPMGLIAAHRFLGELDILEQRYKPAAKHLNESLALVQDCRLPYEKTLTLLALATLSTKRGSIDETTSYLASIRDICEPLGATVALNQATRIEQQMLQSAPITGYPAGLTKREVEVLRQVTLGLTNAEVGELLYISPRTVGQHLSSIYGKTGTTSRAAATRWAIEHDITSD